jgi:FAS-associated factor 2
LIRFPNGERGGRRFPASATVSSIYDYVDSLPSFETTSYKLVSNFPRVVYGEDKLRLTLKEAELHPRASLYIQIEDE